MAYLKDVYRHPWAHNQLLLHETVNVIRALNERQISSMLLKGANLVLVAYQNWALRAMADFDVLVPTSKALEARHVLESLEWEWTSGIRPTSETLGFFHSRGFTKRTGAEFDLHWHLRG